MVSGNSWGRGVLLFWSSRALFGLISSSNGTSKPTQILCIASWSYQPTRIYLSHYPIHHILLFTCSECAKKSNVEEKRAAAIRGFYNKWSPENVDKADALAKKADSNGKMAALFRKLVTKYPKSIRIEVDDEMKMYQDMMNKAKEEKGDDDSDGSDEHDEF